MAWWLVTRQVSAEYENAFKLLTTDHNDKYTKLKELGKGRMKKDYANVKEGGECAHEESESL